MKLIGVLNKGRVGETPTQIIGFWNARGLNKPDKQKEMNLFVHNLKVGLFGFLETRIKRAKALNASFYLCQGWSFVTNLDKYPGGRIWLLWKPHLYDVDIRLVTKQMIHCKVKHKGSRMRFNMTMVYGFNEQAARRKLWEDINQIGAKMDEPWAVMGDFNCILNREERIGSRVTMAETRDFRQCIEACGLKDLRSSGAFIMWNNKQGGDSRVYNRIDKVLVNTEWIIELPPPEVHFMHEGIYDHCPITINWEGRT